MICGKCGKTGHNKRTCGRASKTHRVKPSWMPHAAIGIKRKCKKCGKLGHMAKTCDGDGGGCASWKRELARRAAADADIDYEVIIYDSRKRRRENY